VAFQCSLPSTFKACKPASFSVCKAVRPSTKFPAFRASGSSQLFQLEPPWLFPASTAWLPCRYGRHPNANGRNFGYTLGAPAWEYFPRLGPNFAEPAHGTVSYLPSTSLELRAQFCSLRAPPCLQAAVQFSHLDMPILRQFCRPNFATVLYYLEAVCPRMLPDLEDGDELLLFLVMCGEYDIFLCPLLLPIKPSHSS